jgi:hypothetical protein
MDRIDPVVLPAMGKELILPVATSAICLNNSEFAMY